MFSFVQNYFRQESILIVFNCDFLWTFNRTCSIIVLPKNNGEIPCNKELFAATQSLK